MAPGPKDSTRVKELERFIERQQSIIEELRKPRIKLKPVKAVTAGDGDFIRVVIPDSHG